MSRFVLPIRVVAALALLAMGVLTARGSDSWLSSGSLAASGKSKSKSSAVGVNKANKKPSVVRTASRTMSNIAHTPTELLHKSKSLLPGGTKPTTPSHSRQVSRVQKKEEKPSFFKSLFVSEPPPPPRTVPEWMALKRINP